MAIQENKLEGDALEVEIVLSSSRIPEEERSTTNSLTIDTNTVKGGSSESDPEGQTATARHIERILKPIHDTLRPIGDAVVTPVALVADHLIPKIERIPWYHFFALSIIVAIPAACYIIGFTKIGYGLQTFYFLSRYFEQHAYVLALSLVGFALVLFLLDFHHWHSKCGILSRYIAVSILILGTAVLVCFISATHPYGPISLYIVLMPVWLVLAKNLFYRHLRMRTYVPWLSGPLFFNAVAIMTLWTYWTFYSDTHEWTETTRLADAQVAGCVPDIETYPECDGEFDGVCFEVDTNNPNPPKFDKDCPEICIDVYDNCSNMFIVWVGPFLVSLGLLFLSFFATFLRGTGTVEQEAIRFTKIWFFLLFVMWIASSLAGAGAGVSVTLAALTLSAFIASAILLAFSFTHAEREERVTQLWMNLIEKYDQYLNIAKGLLVVTSAPVFIIYIAISFLNQSVRNINLPCSKKTRTTSESMKNVIGEGLVTEEARRLIKEVKSWELVEVFTYAIYWGTGFMTFTVLAAKFTTLFLSWLIEQTKDMEISVVTGILIGVGVIMFLLPPVPGAPIYLTLGIVMVPVGRDTLGLTYSIFYAMGVSLVLKLFATFLQQKMIGGLLQSNVGIRQLVGINTPLIRAFKLVLAERGFGAAKVSILCGGPDWPTSVLCGIMDLSLWPILVGTIPVLVLIVPTVMAGSFTYMGSLKLASGQPEFSWAGTAATISAAFAAIVLFGFMLLAAYYVEQTMRERGDEIAEIPIDMEVKKLDDEQVLRNKVYEEVTEWHVVPGWAKFSLVLSLICMIMSCYMVQLFQEDAFTPYQLTYTIDRHLGGDWKNLVLPLGWIALLLFGVSLLLFSFVVIWAKRQTDERLKQSVTSRRSVVSVEHVDRDMGVSIISVGSI
eukprot:CAMPEP_0203665284 /NCGR_PEP_ID=MMETSP0090-20130426/2532_1 /ASSEMBLY_ACC=CAM_ASM_001088 /TAXON_ID=426623 /ORGANISM="Chaetoceros affinis, Strain CCMP159" /LENGTH=893 /DNA_ID=CAMNT_0050528793 /DNA_START=83 /DNA_END=2764 /DNA_ORIENTATION=-